MHFYIKEGDGYQPETFVKLVFEIAADQQTRARGPLDNGQPSPYLVQFWLNYANQLNMPKSNIFGALLVASGLLTKSYEPITICPYLDIHTKFDSNRPINW